MSVLENVLRQQAALSLTHCVSGNHGQNKSFISTGRVGKRVTMGGGEYFCYRNKGLSISGDKRLRLYGK